MVRHWLFAAAATLLLAAPSRAQQPPAVDTSWVAALLPIMRSWIGTARVVAVNADSTDPASAALAVALAADRGVRGSDVSVLQAGTSSDCATGDIVLVRWRPHDRDRAGVLTLSFSCRMNGRPFAQGVEQRIERGADGQWRAVGRRGGWTS